MTAKPGAVLYTAEEYSTLRDEEGDELIRGIRVARENVKAQHGRIAVMLAHVMQQYLETHPLGMVFAESGYILERGPDTVRGPDVSFVRTDRLPRDPSQWIEGAPDIAVEILSPSNRRTEVVDKVRQFLYAGARLVWVLEPRRRTVTVHGAEAKPYVLGEGETLDGGDVLPGFRVAVATLFGWPVA